MLVTRVFYSYCSGPWSTHPKQRSLEYCGSDSKEVSEQEAHICKKLGIQEVNKGNLFSVSISSALQISPFQQWGSILMVKRAASRC